MHQIRPGPRAGITLIELVVVLAVMSVLAGIAVQRFQRARVLTDAARVEYAIHAVEEAVMHHMVLDGRIPDGHYDQGALDLFSDILEPGELQPTPDAVLTIDAQGWGVAISMVPQNDRGGEVLQVVQSHRPNVIQDGMAGMKLELWSYELLGPMTQGSAGRVPPGITPGTAQTAQAAATALQAATTGTSGSGQQSGGQTSAQQTGTQTSSQQGGGSTSPQETHGLPASCYNPAGHIRNRPGCRGG
jgi:prepilin-type N-terminal cleavage/methylation domain-containing protein